MVYGTDADCTFCTYFLSPSSVPSHFWAVHIYFIIVAVKCQYFNLHPHFHCFGFILLSRAYSIFSLPLLLLLLLLLILTIWSCLQFWFRRLCSWNLNHTGIRTNTQFNILYYPIVKYPGVFIYFRYSTDWLIGYSKTLLKLNTLYWFLVSNYGCKYSNCMITFLMLKNRIKFHFISFALRNHILVLPWASKFHCFRFRVQ